MGKEDVQEDAIDFVGEEVQNIDEVQISIPSLLRGVTTALMVINSAVENGSQRASKIGQFINLASSWVT
ncbi:MULTISPECIES: hypothetical protein [Bacillus cereus group]|uniref:Uncharacterized protein n=1 Tax=Bacillus mycoides TaxID=1405 RepID=A0A1E8BPZ9_BACMY|nr:hypothetical protein [Bacillus mycoides]MBJ8069107.1 hypothetical protein [Bacillus cereus]MBJ8186682.1 hypothetical protein [Bacillus cereus]OFD44575.1 hypothetical protein BWGOE2_18360 [Bacillus mycoides]OFD47409.1 hypothetical protein BWGOE1_18890 [Bacillus mycoides]OFD96558.1 hypothetical protein BWGOE11_19980 [Bacillus mycoides]